MADQNEELQGTAEGTKKNAEVMIETSAVWF